jgi:hypothetical protein
VECWQDRTPCATSWIARLRGVREIVLHDDAARSGGGTANAALQIMKCIKKTMVVAALLAGLGSALAGCYVEARGPRYAHRTCAYGYYWDGYHCHRAHRW